MSLRLAGYLAFLWANAALGWTFLRESAAGGTPLSAFLRAWWLLPLSALTTLSLVTLTTKDPGNVRKSTAQAGSSPSGMGGGTGGGGGGAGDDQLCPASGSLEGAGGGLAQQQQYFTQVCSLCNYLKPARAHHCRICNRCVLKMDHHCHWVGRCVGAGNYKAYLLTLLYACLSSGAMLVILWRRWRMGRTPESGSAASTSGGVVVGWVEMAGVAVDGLVLGFVFCSVSYLLIWHGYLVAGNVTTIEYFKWKRSMRDPGQYALSPGASVRLSEYDSGLLSNLKEAFGQRVWLWLWPGLGDGCCNRSRGASVRGEEDGGVPSKGGRWIGAARAKRLMSLFAKRRRSVGSGAGAGDGGTDCDPSPVCTEEEDDKLNGSAGEDGSACGRRNNGDGSSSGRRRRREGHEAEGFGLGLEMSDVQSMIDHGGGLEPA